MKARIHQWVQDHQQDVIQLAQALVDHPESVQVVEVNGGRTSIFQLKVLKEDMGKVIGREGKTAQAMRTIVGAVSNKFLRNSILEIVE